MRMHIELDDDLVAEIDRRAGARNRSAYVRNAIAAALDEARRWDLIESAAGAISTTGHEWDADPARWVRGQRRIDRRRIG